MHYTNTERLNIKFYIVLIYLSVSKKTSIYEDDLCIHFIADVRTIYKYIVQVELNSVMVL